MNNIRVEFEGSMPLRLIRSREASGVVSREIVYHLTDYRRAPLDGDVNMFGDYTHACLFDDFNGEKVFAFVAERGHITIISGPLQPQFRSEIKAESDR